jgi:SAM-dependent methyltransferase
VSVAQLVSDHLELVRRAANLGPVLDLACGSGRNGLYLARQDIPVVFADVRAQALDEVAAALGEQSTARLWQVDFEQDGTEPLAGERFGAILVFRYLHRPLMPAIVDAIAPGGLVVYETFTVEQARHGRPKNPDFLLRRDELPGYFRGWQVLHHFEGEMRDRDTGNHQALARLVARKPGTLRE